MTSSKEMVEGSVVSADQVIVQGPPDVGFWEIAKLLTAATKGRKKITLNRKAIVSATCARSRRMNTCRRYALCIQVVVRVGRKVG